MMQNLMPTSRSSSDRARLRRLADRRLEARIAPIPQNLEPCEKIVAWWAKLKLNITLNLNKEKHWTFYEKQCKCVISVQTYS